MMKLTPEEIGAKMNALGLWELLAPYNFGIKARGSIFPYFCTVLKGDMKPVKIRVLLLEGWQTLHDYVRTRVDRNFGFYTTPMEMPHLEMVVLTSGEVRVFRHDVGYMPVVANDAQRSLAARLLWEVYGVMMRLESDGKLALRFAGDKAIFARVEVDDGKWEDQPLVIPDPPAHTEKVSFAKADIKAAKDLPFVKEAAVDVDFRMIPNMMTKEVRPRCVYGLKILDSQTSQTAVDSRVSVSPDIGLRGIWESMPGQVLKGIIRLGKVTGTVNVCSGRVFRLLRPLCMELPFKLFLHDRLDSIERSFGIIKVNDEKRA